MTIAILGTGVMGESVLAGLVKAGWDPAGLRAADARPEQCERIAAKYGVWTGSAVVAADGADTVILVVKPQDIPQLLLEVSPVLDPECLVITLAGGVKIATVEHLLVIEHPVVRAMPNTASQVGQGMTVISPGSLATADHLDRAQKILAAVGKVEVAPEKYLDAITAVSGSGPAYVMYVAEAMIDAGVLLGLPRGLATQLVQQTLYGSATMLIETGDHPAVLRENVTSPGGTTAAALRTLESHGVKAAIIDAMEAACRRSEEMGRS